MGRFLSVPFVTSKDLYSPEGLLDFENEKDLVSVFYLCRAQLLLLFILEYLSTGANSGYSAWGPAISCHILTLITELDHP